MISNIHQYFLDLNSQSYQIKAFDSERHQLTYEGSSKKKLLSIDGRPYYGTEETIPKIKISKLKYIHVNYQLTLPDSALQGIYEPNCFSKDHNVHEYCKVFKSEDDTRIYIYMINGVGKSRYEVTWVIEHSKYKMRVVDAIPTTE